ncbi:hypothetical protein EXIGLDRAFT_751627 [Exidia glandulosa HHB12029]|uniref:NAD dependent epimerase/dehydratase n=1 Tax=Exidia glandulosa HHB12029 TaxID=1314781 RepID=A0A165F937_EXIGL|nr:hypothetical protein EXIGLDRAFT_751627 [Exidia glandulosa HHB12029]
MTDSKPGLQVIGLGLGRTGTGSVKLALEKLGYKVLHSTFISPAVGAMNELTYAEVSEHPKDLQHFSTKWPEVYAKIDNGTITRADWDALFKDYTATQDYPTCMFPNELLAAYPDAKFVLTVREPQKWFDSTVNTIAKTGEWPWWQLSWLLRPQTRGIKRISGRIWKTFFHGRLRQDGVAVYEAHIDECQRVIPASQLLVFSVKDGWEPLCNFLGKDVPEGEFPHEHEGGDMGASIDSYHRQLLKEFTGYVFGSVGAIGFIATLVIHRRTISTLIRGLRS